MSSVCSFSMSVPDNWTTPLFSLLYPLIISSALTIHFKISRSGKVTIHPSITFFSFDLAIRLDNDTVRLGKTSPPKFVFRENVWKKRLPLEAGQRD